MKFFSFNQIIVKKINKNSKNCWKKMEKIGKKWKKCYCSTDFSVAHANQGQQSGQKVTGGRETLQRDERIAAARPHRLTSHINPLNQQQQNIIQYQLINSISFISLLSLPPSLPLCTVIIINNKCHYLHTLPHSTDSDCPFVNFFHFFLFNFFFIFFFIF